MADNISRRAFLRGGAMAAATAAATRLPLPQAVQAAGGKEQDLCTLLDLSKCIGCEACVDACRETWQPGVPDPKRPLPKPFPSRVPTQDWSQRKDVQDRLTPYNWLFVDQLEVEHQGKKRELNVPRRCMHCLNPPCTNLCPFGAGRVEKQGVVRIDPDICLGGSKCKKVCPWSIPQRQSGVGLYLSILPEFAGNGVMFKCHRCWPRVKEGKLPRCIEACPEKVQQIGPRREMVAKAKALVAKSKGYIYGLEENGGTNTIYVSPVPFEAIDRAITKSRQEARAGGPRKGQKRGRRAGQGKGKGNMGRPHMRPVKNAMAHAENLTLALVVAPLAGAAAGLSRFFGRRSSKGENHEAK